MKANARKRVLAFLFIFQLFNNINYVKRSRSMTLIEKVTKLACLIIPILKPIIDIFYDNEENENEENEARRAQETVQNDTEAAETAE
jgi:hypothetical protein